MTREIKFKIWDIKEKKWLDAPRDKCGVEDYCVMDVVKDEDYHVMQYTGLKDKNGKEIYEGDILNYNGKVEFKNGSFVVNEWETIGEMGVDKQEVIGNIYENPELVKGNL